jgi:hypothetical protein
MLDNNSGDQNERPGASITARGRSGWRLIEGCAGNVLSISRLHRLAKGRCFSNVRHPIALLRALHPHPLRKPPEWAKPSAWILAEGARARLALGTRRD